MSIKIFTITHKKCDRQLPEDYVLLHVGKINSEDYGYLGDDTGDHISDKNMYYSELTGLYWIWKNYHDADYVGLCHYRRFFTNDQNEILKSNDYLQLLSEYDVIISYPLEKTQSYYEVYREMHNINDLDVTMEVIKERCPEYLDTFEQVIHDKKIYCANMMVISKEKLNDYAEWLFDILFEVEKRINVEKYNQYHKRVFGFLSEQLMYVWIKYNNLNCYESSYVITNNKVETIELQEKLKSLLTGNRFQEAKTLVINALMDRPDLRYEVSDIDDNLNILILILTVCITELENDLHDLQEKCNDINTLIADTKKLKKVVQTICESQSNQELTSYYNEISEFLISSNFSWVAIVKVMGEFELDIEQNIYILNTITNMYMGHKKYDKVLPFIEVALNLDEKNQTILKTLVNFLEIIGESVLADEYRQQLD